MYALSQTWETGREKMLLLGIQHIINYIFAAVD